jgi:outer membrane protein assembly factor BamB
MAMLAGAGALTVLSTSQASPAALTSDLPVITTSWSVTLQDAGYPIALSSPNVVDLDGQLAIVVGDRAGFVYAYHLADGTPVAGWPFYAGAPVDSTPSVSPINTGGLDSVFVGVGNAANPAAGGYQAISPSGGNQWFVQETNPATDPWPHNGVASSLSVGDLQDGVATDVVSGSMGQEEYAMNAYDGSVLWGFPWFEADSNFTTPALADALGNGQTQIIEGGDSTAGLAYDYQYSNGGHLRVLSPSGNFLQPQPNDGLVCQYDTDQVVQSSPAVGVLGNTGTIGAVFGTGTYWPGASTTNHLLAVDASNCQLMWNVGLDGVTTSSPALADVLGDGQLQVLEGTNNNSGGGSVWALNGADGSTIWRQTAAGEVIGSVVTADLTGSGYQDVIVPTIRGVEVLDGKTGADLGILPGTDAYGFQSSPLVTDDPNGSIGITMAGYNASNEGVIVHCEVAGSTGSAVNEADAWPMFHHDPQLTGDAMAAPTQPEPPEPSPGLPVQRIYGTDAIGTSIAVSQAQYQSAGSAKAVVLARSDYFSDALAGGPLAVEVRGPLLITPGSSLSSSLDPRVQGEIQRVLPSGGTVYVLGGTLALSTNIDAVLESLGYKVVRVAGSDSYATAVAIAGQLGDPSTVFEATATNFADALSAVPAAIKAHGAILLTDGSTQAPETATYLAAHPSDTRYAVGGPLAAAGADPSATAVWGEDLYATSAAVATKFFPAAKTFGAATGLDFPDALSGGVFMGSSSHAGPMLLVEPTLPLPSSVDSYLNSDSAASSGYVFGGPLAVGDDVANAL